MSSIELPEIKPVSIFRQRFSFISDVTLQTNLGIVFQYISFLTVLTNSDGQLPGIIYSIYKDIIVYTATIVEACLHFTLKDQIAKEKIQMADIMPAKWSNKKVVEILSVSPTEKVCGVIEEKRYEN